MNRNKVRQHLCDVLNGWCKTLNPSLAESVRSTAFIAGGAISSLVMGTPVNDYDVYFTDAKVLQEIIDRLVWEWNNITHHQQPIKPYTVDDKPNQIDLRGLPPIVKDDNPAEAPQYAPICFTGNAITLKGGIQIITRFIGEPDEIVRRFDFAHTQCYFRIKTPGTPLQGDTIELSIPTTALESMAAHELIYTGSDYPLSSLIRTKKYIQRGWDVNAGQYLKMAIQLHALDLTKREVLADQLMGVDLSYFANLISTVEKLTDAKEKGETTSPMFGQEPKPINFYDPFYGDDRDSLGHVVLDIISEMWD